MHVSISLTLLSTVILTSATSPPAAPSNGLIFQMHVPNVAPGLLAKRHGERGPDIVTCTGGGDTCAEACGFGFRDCSSNAVANLCFNPAEGESCCADGRLCVNGNTCTESGCAASGFGVWGENGLGAWHPPRPFPLPTSTIGGGGFGGGGASATYSYSSFSGYASATGFESGVEVSYPTETGGFGFDFGLFGRSADPEDPEDNGSSASLPSLAGCILAFVGALLAV